MIYLTMSNEKINDEKIMNSKLYEKKIPNNKISKKLSFVKKKMK